MFFKLQFSKFTLDYETFFHLIHLNLLMSIGTGGVSKAFAVDVLHAKTYGFLLFSHTNDFGKRKTRFGRSAIVKSSQFTFFDTYDATHMLYTQCACHIHRFP